MDNLVILRIELFIFISSLTYSVYYLANYFLNIFNKIKKLVVQPKKVSSDSIQTVNVNKEKSKVSIKKTYDWAIKNLTDEERVKISEIMKRVKINIEKGYYDTARTLIIEWLTIDKYNKDLNMELAHMYEMEKNYKNAEFIYRDMCLVHKDNTSLLKKLAYIVAMQWNLNESVIIYEKVHERMHADNEVIELLASLTFEIMNFEKSLKYIKLVLKEKPKNLEMMKMKATALEKVGKIKDAIKVYEDILYIRPYDTNTIDNIKRLEQNIIS